MIVLICHISCSFIIAGFTISLHFRVTVSCYDELMLIRVIMQDVHHILG